MLSERFHTWNDNIDPNPKYLTDRVKSAFAELITLGRADRRAIAMGIAVLASLGVLAACGSETRRASTRLATPGHPLISPSGRYELAVVTGRYGSGAGTYSRIQIRDRSGRVELDSRNRFSTRFATSILWDDDRDRSWVHSADVGTSWWDRVADGRWRRGGLDPLRIARGVPRIPRALVAMYPKEFGPEARKEAERNIIPARDVSPKCGSADDDIRIECPDTP